MSVPTKQNLYGVSIGSTNGNSAIVPIHSTRNPTAQDYNYPIGQTWINSSVPSQYVLGNVTTTLGVSTATWLLTALNSGDLETLSGDTGTATPVSSNIQIAGSGDISTSATGDTVTISISGGTDTISQLDGDSGSASPTAGGVVNISGTSDQIGTSAASDTVTLAFTTNLNCNWGFINSGSMGVGVSSCDDGTANGYTAVGAGALGSNTANDNTAVGYLSMSANTSGTGHTAVGLGSLSTNTTGEESSAVGFNALNLCEGSYNTAMGAGCMISVSSGTANTAVGRGALVGITTGTNNVGIGEQAGSSYATGSESNNIVIGRNLGGTNGESNAIRIGNGSTTCFVAGIRGVTTANADAVAVLVDSADQLGTVSSSIRYKEQVEDLKNSDVVHKLRPVSFKYKSQSSDRPQFGLIAEEVYEVLPDIVVKDKEGHVDTLQYQVLPILLLAEVQKLRKEIDDLKAKYVSE